MENSLEANQKSNKDLSTSKDIDYLVRTFYSQAIDDELIGHFFTKVVELDFDKHIPKIVDFWTSVLLGQGNYRGNPIIKHIELSQKSPLTKTHFDRWIQLWKQTLDDNYSGPIADQAKEKAQTISQLMIYKIEASSKNGYIL